MVERLAAALRIDFGRLMARRILQIMRPSSVQQLAAAGVDFQLHTHRHRAPLDRDLFMKEIEENRTRIQQLTGKRPSHFCYPSGNYRAEFLTWLEEEQVVSGVTCDPRARERRSHIVFCCLASWPPKACLRSCSRRGSQVLPTGCPGDERMPTVEETQQQCRLALTESAFVAIASALDRRGTGLDRCVTYVSGVTEQPETVQPLAAIKADLERDGLDLTDARFERCVLTAAALRSMERLDQVPVSESVKALCCDLYAQAPPTPPSARPDAPQLRRAQQGRDVAPVPGRPVRLGTERTAPVVAPEDSPDPGVVSDIARDRDSHAPIRSRVLRPHGCGRQESPAART